MKIERNYVITKRSKFYFSAILYYYYYYNNLVFILNFAAAAAVVGFGFLRQGSFVRLLPPVVILRVVTSRVTTDAASQRFFREARTNHEAQWGSCGR